MVKPGWTMYTSFRKIQLILWLSLFGYACMGLHDEKGPLSAEELLHPDGCVAFLDQAREKVITSIWVDISDTPETRRMGLMWRHDMDSGYGMLFIYENDRPRSFWMRNTPIPLDIIFVNKNREIINIAANTAPMSDHSYISHGPVRYVVEVRAGFCKKHRIKKGMGIEWKRQPSHREPNPAMESADPYWHIYDRIEN
jgi:uncharacterized membrane protein (UPF0127 family)